MMSDFIYLLKFLFIVTKKRRKVRCFGYKSQSNHCHLFSLTWVNVNKNSVCILTDKSVEDFAKLNLS